MRLLPLFALAPTLAACTTTPSPLVEAAPQVELTANPGGVAGHAPFSLTLTTWNHLAALADATTSGELEASLDGTALVIDPSATGYAGEDDSYTAAFALPAGTPAIATNSAPASSLVTVSDGDTTWSVAIAGLFTNDLAPTGPVLAAQPTTLVWPSAATSDPWSTIDFACVDVAQRAAACHSDAAQDPGIAVSENVVDIDLAAQPGDAFVIWGSRWSHPAATGDGPVFFASILNQVTGTFE